MAALKITSEVKIKLQLAHSNFQSYEFTSSQEFTRPQNLKTLDFRPKTLSD